MFAPSGAYFWLNFVSIRQPLLPVSEQGSTENIRLFPFGPTGPRAGNRKRKGPQH